MILSHQCTELSERPCAFFELRHPEDTNRFCSFDQRDLMIISAMLRHAVLEKVKIGGREFFDSYGIDIKKYIAGHAGSSSTTEGIERFSYLPIPTINFHRENDGFIRRVIVAEPFFGNEDY